MPPLQQFLLALNSFLSTSTPSTDPATQELLSSFIEFSAQGSKNKFQHLQALSANLTLRFESLARFFEMKAGAVIALTADDNQLRYLTYSAYCWCQRFSLSINKANQPLVVWHELFYSEPQQCGFLAWILHSGYSVNELIKLGFFEAFNNFFKSKPNLLTQLAQEPLVSHTLRTAVDTAYPLVFVSSLQKTSVLPVGSRRLYGNNPTLCREIAYLHALFNLSGAAFIYAMSANDLEKLRPALFAVLNDRLLPLSKEQSHLSDWICDWLTGHQPGIRDRKPTPGIFSLLADWLTTQTDPTIYKTMRAQYPILLALVVYQPSLAKQFDIRLEIITWLTNITERNELSSLPILRCLITLLAQVSHYADDDYDELSDILSNVLVTGCLELKDKFPHIEFGDLSDLPKIKRQVFAAVNHQALTLVKSTLTTAIPTLAYDYRTLRTSWQRSIIPFRILQTLYPNITNEIAYPDTELSLQTFYIKEVWLAKPDTNAIPPTDFFHALWTQTPWLTPKTNAVVNAKKNLKIQVRILLAALSYCDEPILQSAIIAQLKKLGICDWVNATFDKVPAWQHALMASNQDFFVHRSYETLRCPANKEKLLAALSIAIDKEFFSAIEAAAEFFKLSDAILTQLFKQWIDKLPADQRVSRGKKLLADILEAECKQLAKLVSELQSSRGKVQWHVGRHVLLPPPSAIPSVVTEHSASKEIEPDPVASTEALIAI